MHAQAALNFNGQFGAAAASITNNLFMNNRRAIVSSNNGFNEAIIGKIDF